MINLYSTVSSSSKVSFNEEYLMIGDDIKIVFNGEELKYDYDTTGTIKLYNGTTYVPYRAFLEMLGYKVTWDVHSSKITATKEGSEISLILLQLRKGGKQRFDLECRFKAEDAQ